MFKYAVSAMILCLLTAGCGIVARNETSPSPHNNNGVHVQQTTPRGKSVASPVKVTDHLEALARKVPGVKAAHCVVIGNTAVVGVDVDGNLDRSRVGTIKYAVAEAFRKDPYGMDAVVTADVDINHRLKEMGADIRKGRPVRGFAEELSDIIGRIVPQMPRDTVPRSAEPVEQKGTKLNKHL